MFVLACLIIAFGLSIYFLGLSELLYSPYIAGLTFFYFFLAIVTFYLRANFKKLIKNLKIFYVYLQKHIILQLTILLILAQIIINLIGAFGPELSFDALWYHLTLPKLYLQNHKIFFVPGGLLYYSAFPQLIEMLYLAGLSLGGLIIAKLINFSFAILCLFAVYKLFKRFNIFWSIIAVLIFYSQLVVGWLSTTAYIDLARAFFEILALIYFLNWLEKKECKEFLKSAVMTGASLCTKLLSFSSLFSFLILIILFTKKNKLSLVFKYLIISLSIPLPWFIRNLLIHKNPFYPMFTDWFFKAQSNGLSLKAWLISRNPIALLEAIYKTAFTKGDILTLLLIISIPLIILKLKALSKIKPIVFYFIINFIIFFLTPLNYNRFLLPYIPAFIYIYIFALKKSSKYIKNINIALILIISLINLLFRTAANYKYIKLYTGRLSQNSFMKQYLDFNVGNFYDFDNWFKTNITSKDKVLVLGLHNLFYLNFSFDHISWASKQTYYSHILVYDEENNPIPNNFKGLKLVYENNKSRVRVYEYKDIFD
jgi:hypothetical protein